MPHIWRHRTFQQSLIREKSASEKRPQRIFMTWWPSFNCLGKCILSTHRDQANATQHKWYQGLKRLICWVRLGNQEERNKKIRYRCNAWLTKAPGNNYAELVKCCVKSLRLLMSPHFRACVSSTITAGVLSLWCEACDDLRAALKAGLELALERTGQCRIAQFSIHN